MFHTLGVQLYTVRDYLNDPEFADLAFHKLAELGYREVQTAGNEDKLAELIAKNDLKIVGTHYNFQKIMNEPDRTMELHRKWGTTNIGIGGMPVPARTDLAKLKKFIYDFNITAEKYAKCGFKLTYHNHNFEFTRIDGYQTLMDLLYEGLDPATTSFVLDTCWVAAGGADVIDWMEKLEGRIDILHLKDLTLITNKSGSLEPTMTEVGYGNLAWDRIIATAEKIGVKHYVVEQDQNFSKTPFESLRMSMEFLKKYQTSKE